MRAHPEDSRIAVLDDIREGECLRRSWLQRMFGKQAPYPAFAFSSPAHTALVESAEEFFPALQALFTRNAERIYSIEAKYTKGQVYGGDTLVVSQSLQKTNGRRMGGRNQKAIWIDEVKPYIGKINTFLQTYGDLVAPIVGKNSILTIADRTIGSGNYHKDFNDMATHDPMTLCSGLGREQPATVLAREVEAGTENAIAVKFWDQTQKEIEAAILPIYFDPNTLVGVNDEVLHASPSVTRFRPVAIAQPNPFA